MKKPDARKLIVEVLTPVSTNRLLIHLPCQQIVQQLGDIIKFILADTERSIRRTFIGVPVIHKTEAQQLWKNAFWNIFDIMTQVHEVKRLLKTKDLLR
jgi:hypothetical protein